MLPREGVGVGPVEVEGSGGGAGVAAGAGVVQGARGAEAAHDQGDSGAQAGGMVGRVERRHFLHLEKVRRDLERLKRSEGNV